MGSSASIWGHKVVRPQSKYTSRFDSSSSSGSFVVATSDFDPDDIHWPETWGVPLPLRKSVAIRIINDGGDRAFGHYVGQPEKRGYFLKHLTEALGSEPPSATPSIEQPFSKAHVQLPHVHHIQNIQGVQSQIQHRSSELSPPLPTPQPQESGRSGRIPSEASTSIPCSPQSPEYLPTSPFVPDQTPVSLTSFPPPTSPHSSLSATATRRLDSLDRDRVDKCDKPEASKAHETLRLRGPLQTASCPSSHFSLPHVVPKLERFEPFKPEESGHSSAGSNPKFRMRASEIPHDVDMHGRPTDFRGAKAEDEGDEGALGALGAMNESHPRCQTTSSVRSTQLWQLETQPRNPSDPLDPVAAELGLDPQTEEHLLWLVDAAASVELPEGWITFPDDDGRAVYYHERKLFVTRKHPMLQRFKVYAEQLQKFYQTLSSKALNSTKIRAHLAVILNEVLNRCHRELPPMTPVLLERTAVLLGIDTTSEFLLSTKAPSLH